MEKFPEGFVQIGMHTKGGGVDTANLIRELNDRGLTVFEDETTVVYGTSKN
jgi:hypothetical protein